MLTVSSLVIGWKKQLAYCIAFSADGCQDVTRRYVRDPIAHALPRQRATEAQLQHILLEIKALRRRDIDKQDRFRLNAEEMREDAELRKMIIETLARNVARISTAAYTPMEGVVATAPAARVDLDAQKAAERRQAGIDARRAYVTEQQQQQQQPPQD